MHITTNCGKTVKRWEYHLICFLRNLHAGQKTTLELDIEQLICFTLGKGVPQGGTLSSCLFNLYTEYFLQNAGLDESQAGIKIAGRNINSLRYVADTTLMTESEEELNSLLTKVIGESE